MSAASTLHHRLRRGTVIHRTTAATVTFSLLLGLSQIRVSASAGQSASAAPVIEETFVLKHIKPSVLVTFLAQGDKPTSSAKPATAAPRNASVLLTDRIKSVTPDDVFSTVTIQGAPDAIAAIRKVASLLDVPPQPVRLAVRIIRYRSGAAQKQSGLGTAAVADVEEVASGVVETASNTPVELTTYGDGHTFRARLVPHINNAASVSVAADLQMASPDGVFVPFPADFSGTRLLRVGDRGLITSVGSGISTASRPAVPTDPKAAPRAPDVSEKVLPETYYLEATPTIPPAATTGKAEPSAANP